MTRWRLLTLLGLAVTLAAVIALVYFRPWKSQETPAARARIGTSGACRLGETTAYHVAINERAFVTWVDTPWGKGESAIGSLKGSHTDAEGRRVDWECLTTDGTSGVVEVNGQKFDFAAGRVFLVSGSGATTQVRQLRLEVKGSVEELEALADTDADVRAFLASASARKERPAGQE